MAHLLANEPHFAFQNKLDKPNSTEFDADMILEGQSGQMYGLQTRIGNGSFGVVFDAIRIERSADGSGFRAQPSHDLCPIVVKMIKRGNFGKHEISQLIEL